jgi:hypothetical protein
MTNYQNYNNQTKIDKSKLMFKTLEFGNWSLFGIWCLEFVIYL